jgi:hypothetical protein
MLICPTGALALLGDSDASACELLFFFSTPEEKDQFLDLVRSNENLGDDFIENDFMSPPPKRFGTPVRSRRSYHKM